MSLETTSSSMTAICQAPMGARPPGHSPSGMVPAACSGSAAKLMKNGTQPNVKTPAKMLLADPAALSIERHSRTATALSNRANSWLSMPPK